MSDSRSVETPETEGQAAPRKAYECPRLTEFGSVRDLTRAGSGGSGELAAAKKRS